MTQIPTSLLTIEDITNYRTSTMDDKRRIDELIRSAIPAKPDNVDNHAMQIVPFCLGSRARFNGLGGIAFDDYSVAIWPKADALPNYKVLSVPTYDCSKADVEYACIWLVSSLSKKLALTSIYMDSAKRYASLSTCTRRKVGAILVKDGRVISTGTNGAPEGQPHCIDDGCLLDDKGHCQRTVHAEQNAVLFCASHGISMSGTLLVCTDFPCTKCLQSLLQTGIMNIYFDRDYTDMHNKALAKSASSKIGFYNYSNGLIEKLNFEK